MNDRIGPYQIQRELGRGGMGVVYLATDERLGRQVAIKALPPELAEDPSRLERFEREARTLAALSHPNLAGIYGVEEQGGSRYLILEYVEGETLEDRLNRGPLPLDDALELAVQIAAGVEAAHEAGIVHRDLKPANIVITPDGVAKVLDFGLARVDEPGSSSTGAVNQEADTLAATRSLPPNPRNSPTIAGAILGTAAYMSPEQARGRRVDKRSDIWSFGVVLYEMLAGQSPFRGETASDSIGAVLHKGVEFDTLPPATPASVRRVLDRCLQRDRNLRYRDIGDVRIELAIGDRASERASSPKTRLSPMAIALIAVVALFGVRWWLSPDDQARPPKPTLALSITPPPGAIWEVGSNIGWVMISPDGKKIVAKASSDDDSGLWVRTLSDPVARLLPGTAAAFYPFWSPDSRRVGFFSDEWLHVVDIEGGLPERIAPADQGRGASWSDDGRILLCPEGGGSIHIVDASGGQPRPVTELDEQAGENAHYWPQWLPDGEHFLYMIRTRSQNDQGVYLGRVTDGIDTERRRIVSAASSAWFVPEHQGDPAVLLWIQDGELLARRFNYRAGELTGPTTRVASGVRVLQSQLASLVSVSDDGTIVYASDRFGYNQLVWHDRVSGSVNPVGQLRGQMNHLTLSPDGKRASLTKIEAGQANIWTFDIATETARQVTNIPGYSERAVWSPDSRRLAFRNDGSEGAFIIAADGSGTPRPVFEPPEEPGRGIVAWLPGDWIVYNRESPGSDRGSLLTARLGDIPATERVLLDAANTNLNRPRFSRNGTYVSVYNTARGSSSLILRSIELGPDGPRLRDEQVIVPIASPIDREFSYDESELFVVAKGGRVFAVGIERTEDGGLRLDRPRQLGARLPIIGFSYFAADPSGARFLMATDPNAASQTFEILTNWRTRLSEE